jgi:hypothetical protein
LRTGGKLGIRSSRAGAGRNRKSGDWSAKKNWSVDLVTGPEEVRVLGFCILRNDLKVLVKIAYLNLHKVVIHPPHAVNRSS